MPGEEGQGILDPQFGKATPGLPRRATSFADYARRRPRRDGATTSDQVTDVLRDAIFDGIFEPGARLREVNLATDLNVSRTPVRDALRTLAAEGLLNLHANKGAVLAPLSTDIPAPPR